VGRGFYSGISFFAHARTFTSAIVILETAVRKFTKINAKPPYQNSIIIAEDG
jgi:hypothetical protein